MKKKIDRQDFIQFKNSSSGEDTGQRMRRQARNWKKILQKKHNNKVHLLRMFKEFLKFNNQKTNNSIKDKQNI